MKFIIDTSSILSAFMHLEDREFGQDVQFEEQTIHIPDLETCMERAKDSFNKTLAETGFSYVDCIFVLDQSGTGAARKKLYHEYKGKRGNRPKQYYDVYNQFVTDFVEYAMSRGAISCVAKVVPACEADDLINEICTRFPNTALYTRDKDLLAVPAKHHLIDKELNPVKFPVPRDLIRLYRSIVTGDTSDNIPSCKGFGEKAWERLVELVGQEGLYELDKMVQEKRLHELADDVPHMKKLQLLIDQAETVYLAYELFTFAHVPAHKVAWSARVTECSQKLVTVDNYYQAVDEVKAALVGATHVVIDYETSVPEESFAWLAGTDGAVKVDVMASQITGMGLKIGDQCWYFSVNHKDTRNITTYELEKIINLFKNMEGYAQNLVGFENVVTYNHFGFMFENFHDTRVLASYIDENETQGLKQLSARWLNYTQETYEALIASVEGARQMCDITGEQVLKYGLEDVITTDSIRNLFTCIALYENTWEVFKKVEQKAGLVTSYAFCKGVDFDWEVYNKLKADNDANILRAEAELEEMLLDIGWGEKEYKPFLILNASTVKKVYALMTGEELPSTIRSVGKAIEALGSLGTEESVMLIDAVRQGIDSVNELASQYWKPVANLNVRSPKQIQELMYDKLSLPIRIRNAPTDKMRERGVYEGSPTTDDTAIENAIAFGDCSEKAEKILRKLLEFKEYLTRESLFLSKYPGYVHWKTKKLHCNMQISGTTTRRFTHSAPQLAQLPKKKGKEMRDMLTVPGEDWVMVSLDYAGQEIRLAAWDSKDANLLSCFIGTKDQCRDVHSMVAQQIMVRGGNNRFKTYEEFKTAIDDKDTEAKEFRTTAKGVVFGTQYGCRAKKLGQMLCCTEQDAQSFMQAKDETFPELQPYISKWIKICRDRGYSTTFLGARRHLAKKWGMAKAQSEIESVDRLAWSFRIQGSAGEMTKLGMCHAYDRGILDENCAILFSVHDEIVGIIHKSVLKEKLIALHSCITTQYADMEIPLESTPEVGTHFGSLEEIDLTNL